MPLDDKFNALVRWVSCSYSLNLNMLGLFAEPEHVELVDSHYTFLKHIHSNQCILVSDERRIVLLMSLNNQIMVMLSKSDAARGPYGPIFRPGASRP